MTNVSVTYVGGLDAVQVYLPSGDVRTVQRGETAKILAADAAVLSPDEWAAVAPEPKE